MWPCEYIARGAQAFEMDGEECDESEESEEDESGRDRRPSAEPCATAQARDIGAADGCWACLAGDSSRDGGERGAPADAVPSGLLASQAAFVDAHMAGSTTT